MLRATFNQGVLITDPCYLIHDDQWVFEDGNDDYVAQVGTMLSQAGFSKSLVAETGWGDWTNFISVCGRRSKDEPRLFTADAGMVCVVPFDEYLELLKQKRVRITAAGCAAFVADFTGRVEIDVSNKNWTVISGRGNVSFNSVSDAQDGEEDL